jgi:S-adenosyl methyltransferase
VTEEPPLAQDDPEQDITGTGIDTTVPHSARIWNYWLGGKDNYAVDREAATSTARSSRASPWWLAPREAS